MVKRLLFAASFLIPLGCFGQSCFNIVTAGVGPGNEKPITDIAIPNRPDFIATKISLEPPPRSRNLPIWPRGVIQYLRSIQKHW